MCGKVGCGKTTLAKKIEKELKAVRFSIDEFMLGLFGEIEDRKQYEEQIEICKKFVFKLAKSVLENFNVVLDVGAWQKAERDFLREYFKDFEVIFVYLKKSEKDIFEQIKRRNKNLKENEYFIDKKTFDFFCSKFEEPKDENMLIYEYDDEKFFQKLKNKE